MHRIGFMQGRLSPMVDGKIQAFPWGSWEAEFALGREHAFGVMEWVFEADRFDDNPLWTQKGRSRIRSLVDETGTRVESVVADYFMDHPLVTDQGRPVEESRRVLEQLTDACGELGVTFLEIPLVDGSRLGSKQAVAGIREVLAGHLPHAERAGVKLSLETDLPPGPFRLLLDSFPDDLVSATYDMGNSASLGFDPDEEIPTLGRSIVNVHVKDRKLGGGTVPLGEGDADLPRVFRGLRGIGFDGTYILQTARLADDVATACRFRDQVADLIERAECGDGA